MSSLQLVKRISLCAWLLFAYGLGASVTVRVHHALYGHDSRLDSEGRDRCDHPLVAMVWPMVLPIYGGIYVVRLIP
jgi:hypothetical protein